MDEKVKKAFDVANYMATLSNQKRIVLEEFNQRMVYYVNGGTFKVSKELINFTKSLLDLGHTGDIVFIDENNMPVMILDLQDFLNNILSVYFEATNWYHTKYNELRSKRQVEAIVNL